jgi:DNA repair photolyase
MSRRAFFVPYRPKTILNKSKRPDHWFWTRYSAYPYIGCQHGCEFCYLREEKYSPYDQIEDYPFVIKVKENAPELLRKALSRTPVDVVFTADYQPLERKFLLSRKMLEVCHDLGFPVFILERSPLILRDLDLIKAIQEKAAVVTAFSVIYTPDSPNAGRIRKLERLAPPPEKRFAAMEKLSAAGLLSGTCFMPVLPNICDNAENIDLVVRWTADHGGKFVITSGLTLADQQRSYFMDVLEKQFPELVNSYRSLYPSNSYSAVGNQWRETALRVREACQKYGILDRIPRPIISGDKREFNKRIVERLANQSFSKEIEAAPSSEVWEYRKAAWAIEDLEQDVRLIYRQMGLKGLQSIPDLSPSIATYLEQLIAAGQP